MTLIPAFACKGGFAICADSEENCGAFRKSVQKIIPMKMGRLDVIIAGAGIGDLIDSFTARLKERLDRNEISDIREFKRIMEQRLVNFYSTDVEHYPRSNPEDESEKRHKFIVAAYSPDTHEFAVWSTRFTTLIPVSSYELAGVEDPLYDHFALTLYRPDMTFPQAMLAGLYLLTIAAATSVYVRAPYRLAVVSAAGIELEKESNVTALTERLAAYRKHVDELFLNCADVNICLPDFEDRVEEFKRTALALHREHIDQRAAETSIADLLTFDANPLRPIGQFTFYANGGLKAIHDRETVKELRENMEEFRRLHDADNPRMIDGRDIRLMQCKNASCDGRKFLAKLIRPEDRTATAIEGTCPQCHEFQREEFKPSVSQTSALAQ